MALTKVLGNVIADDTIGSDKIADDAITSAQIADSAVTDTKLTLAANSSAIKTALNASGDAPVYACRAWVNFDGTTATPSTIRGSGNVSSITRNAQGDYTVNFTTAMPDANYSYCFGHRTNDSALFANSNTVLDTSVAPATSSLRIGVGASNGVKYNSNHISVAIFR